MINHAQTPLPEATIQNQINLAELMRQDRLLFTRNKNENQQFGICMMTFTRAAEVELEMIIHEFITKNDPARFTFNLDENEGTDTSRPLRFIMSAMELAERPLLYQAFVVDEKRVAMAMITGDLHYHELIRPLRAMAENTQRTK